MLPGQVIDSAISYIGIAAGGTAGAGSWVMVPGCLVIVPAGIPYSLDLTLQVGIFPGSAAVGSGLHFNPRIWNSAGVAVNSIPPYGQGGLFVAGHDEYYVVPVVGQTAVRTHTQHWDMPPLASADVYSVYMQSSTIGSPTASYAASCPAPGSFVGGPTTLIAKRAA